MKDYWVYMLLCSDGSYYIGITNDVERRVAEHKDGLAPGCYTQTRLPVDLVYCTEAIHDVNDAIAFEKRIKGWSRAKKAALARGDWDEIKRLSNAKKARPSTSSGPPFDTLRMTRGHFQAIVLTHAAH